MRRRRPVSDRVAQTSFDQSLRDKLSLSLSDEEENLNHSMLNVEKSEELAKMQMRTYAKLKIRIEMNRHEK